MTDFGTMINHSWKPTAKLVYSNRDEVYYVQAKKPISKGEEITLNYNDSPWYMKGPGDW